MAAAMMRSSCNGAAGAAVSGRRGAVTARRGAAILRRAAASEDLGFKTMRNGVKEASDETLLTPRFYTTCVRLRAGLCAGRLLLPPRPMRRMGAPTFCLKPFRHYCMLLPINWAATVHFAEARHSEHRVWQ